VKLKLYPDAPLLKLAILDDHIWIQHYHAGLDIQRMPEYVFRHDKNLSSLYIPFYQFFMAKWNDRGVPEYDLESDELTYRDTAGNEIRREKWNAQQGKMTPRGLLEQRPVPTNGDPLGRVVYPLRQNQRSLGCIEEAFRNVW